METSDQIVPLLESSVTSHKVTGASIAILDGEHPVSVQHVGYADKKNKILVGENTLFRIGSITKVFTASAVMQLVEREKINIDEPLQHYLPEFRIKSRFSPEKPVTVRDILCHHSGLPCDHLKNYFTNDPEAFHSALPYLATSYLVHPPGEQFYYSNLGYELLGILIARISGIPYHRYVETRILEPLGMSHSRIILENNLRENLSKPYRKGKEESELMMRGIPEGGIHATATDMGCFMREILNGGTNLFQSAETLRSMFEVQYPDNPRDMDFTGGLGWFVGYPGLNYAGKVIWHDGGTPHFFSLLLMIPERKLGITLLTNSTTGAAMNHRVSVDILKRILQENFDIKPTELQVHSSLLSNQAPADHIAGKYFTLSGIAALSVKKNKVIARLSSGRFRLHPSEDGWFRLSLLLFGIIPLRLRQLAQLRLGVVDIADKKVLAIKQLGFRSPQGSEWHPLEVMKDWKARIGKYLCAEEPNPRVSTFTLTQDKNGLFLTIPADKTGKLQIYLDLINTSEALTLGYGRYAGETIFADHEDIMLFGLRYQKQ